VGFGVVCWLVFRGVMWVCGLGLGGMPVGVAT